jgi:hypothetical protein
MQKKLTRSQTPQENNALERQIAANDKQIDNLVYDAYGLTHEEIETIEGDSEVIPRASVGKTLQV